MLPFLNLFLLVNNLKRKKLHAIKSFVVPPELPRFLEIHQGNNKGGAAKGFAVIFLVDLKPFQNSKNDFI